jgi:phage gp46-like protein
MSWRINPKTGDYVMTNGAPVDDPSLIYPAYYRIMTKRTRWLYAPDDSFGSDLYTIKKRFNPGDVSPLANIVDAALQPMIDDGRATDVETTYLAPQSLYDTQLSVQITDAQGQPQTLNLPAVGG